MTLLILMNDQSRKDMLEACHESRHSGKLVEKLVEGIAVQVKIQWWRKFVGGIVNK